MSLVNDMLNDLDEQHKKHSSDANISVAQMIGEKKGYSRNPYFLGIVAAFVAILLLIAYSLWKSQLSQPIRSVQEMTARDSGGAEIKDDPIAVNNSTAIDKNIINDDAVVENQLTDLSAMDSKLDVSSDVAIVSAADQFDENVSESGFNAVEKPTAIDQKNTLNGENAGAENLGGKSVDPENVVADVVKNVVTKDVVTKQIIKTNASSKTVNATDKLVSIKKAPLLSMQQQDVEISKQANSLLQQGLVAQAEAMLQNFLRSQPTAVSSGTLLTNIYLSQQNYISAEQQLRVLNADKSRSNDLKMLQARLWLLTGRAGKAIDLLMLDKPLIANNFSYYELLALAARKNNQFTLSEQTYRGLLGVENSRGDWWVGLAIALDAQGNMGGASSAYSNALKTSEISTALRDYARQRLTAMGASSDLGA